MNTRRSSTGYCVKLTWGPHELEMAKLFRVLQMYHQRYEAIPLAIDAVVSKAEQLRKQMAALNETSRKETQSCAKLAGQVIAESKQINGAVTGIAARMQAVTQDALKDLAVQMSTLVQKEIEKAVFGNLQERLQQFAESNQALDQAIAGSKAAAETLRKEARLSRQLHIGAYALASFVIAAGLTLGSWFVIRQSYLQGLERERQALIKQTDKHREILTNLARSKRSLELLQDPKHPRRYYVVMKGAQAWQTQDDRAVIEFSD
jgi:DNA repair exonuclease SbcCD ATPase subunit